MTKQPPALLKGTRDFLPAQMRQRQAVQQLLQSTFERYGFDPIETPILNPAETILGKYGEEGDRLTYHFQDNGGRSIALPYDLTVPFARFVAQHWRDLPLPFKRYQIQRVWRAEKPQKGRLREFYQCDIDVIGTKSLLAEAEMIRIIYDVFSRLPLQQCIIQVNSRRLMNAILARQGIPSERLAAVLRLVDKLDKIGVPGVTDELVAVGVTKAERLLTWLQPGADNAATLQQLRDFDTSELTAVLAYTQALGVPDGMVKIVPTLARGLDYYTGLVIETIIPNSGVGVLCAGGRYDNLCSMFCPPATRLAGRQGQAGDQDFSGVGVSFGFERVMLLLEQLNGTAPVPTKSTLLTLFDNASIPAVLRLQRQLIAAGIASEMYFQPDKLTKQLKYANAKGMTFVVLYGPDEQAAGTVTVKQMQSGTQKTIPVNQLVQYIQGFYV